MDNDAVAAVFEEMGDLLAIAGGDAHRSRAFRNTARIVEGLGTPLRDLLLLGRLQKVPGIGSGSVERIQQILATGTCPDHQRLLTKLPVGLREMLHLRGMSARSVRLVWERLHVGTVEQLEFAARNGLLAQVDGIGPRSIERLLNHLDQRRAGGARRALLSDALRLGAELVAWMREDPTILRVEQTGSARRRQETVGDLDVLVATMHPKRASARFIEFPGVREVLLEGSSRASMILDSGLQADLRTITPETWGAGLHYFTGNRAHNIQLRLRGNHRNVSISEHGIYEQVLKGHGTGEANRRIARRLSAGTEEVDVFTVVGLPFIAPELRAGEGEIEAADHGKLPLLVEEHHLIGDASLRAPTAAVLAAQLQAMTRQPLRWVCWIRDAVDVVDTDARARFRREARLVGERFGVRVFCGVEVAVDDNGHVDIADDVRADLDVVVGDCSVSASSGGPTSQEVPSSTKPQSRFSLSPQTLTRAQATQRLIAVVESGRVDGLSRVNGRKLLQHDGVDIDVYAVLLACARHGVFVEVSGEPDRLDLDHRSCHTARDVGAALSITARAADVASLERRRYGLWQARRGWVTASSVLNAFDVDEVARRFKRGGRTAIVEGDVAAIEIEMAEPVSASSTAMVEAPLHKPLTPELRERIEAFLMGAVDDDLRRRLEQDGGNALQSAFALLAP